MLCPKHLWQKRHRKWSPYSKVTSEQSEWPRSVNHAAFKHLCTSKRNHAHEASIRKWMPGVLASTPRIRSKKLAAFTKST